MKDDYLQFVAAKIKAPDVFGHEPGPLHESLFDFQAAVTKWAIRRGRAAIFMDCGLGKTRCQLEWARPIWYDIDESDTLNTALAREEKDERHICPLQLGTIERCVRLWSLPGEVVLSPFAGIGSEGVVALRQGRKFLGIELKESYYKTAVRNLQNACRQTSIFDRIAAEPS